MLNDVVEVLQVLGILPVIQFTTVAVTAIFLFRYFTDKG